MDELSVHKKEGLRNGSHDIFIGHRGIDAEEAVEHQPLAPGRIAAAAFFLPGTEESPVASAAFFAAPFVTGFPAGPPSEARPALPPFLAIAWARRPCACAGLRRPVRGGQHCFHLASDCRWHRVVSPVHEQRVKNLVRPVPARAARGKKRLAGRVEGRAHTALICFRIQNRPEQPTDVIPAFLPLRRQRFEDLGPVGCRSGPISSIGSKNASPKSTYQIRLI